MVIIADSAVLIKVIAFSYDLIKFEILALVDLLVPQIKFNLLTTTQLTFFPFQQLNGEDPQTF